MKVLVRARKNTELVRGGNRSSFVAGPLKTLSEINGFIVAEGVPTRSPRARILNSHGYPETLEFLGKSMIPRGGSNTWSCEIHTLQGREPHNRYCSISYGNALRNLIPRRLIWSRPIHINASTVFPCKMIGNISKLQKTITYTVF